MYILFFTSLQSVSDIYMLKEGYLIFIEWKQKIKMHNFMTEKTNKERGSVKETYKDI
jgi:hypothetical protein